MHAHADRSTMAGPTALTASVDLKIECRLAMAGVRSVNVCEVFVIGASRMIGTVLSVTGTSSIIGIAVFMAAITVPRVFKEQVTIVIKVIEVQW